MKLYEIWNVSHCDHSVMVIDACQYVAREMVEWEKNLVFLGIEGCIFSGAFPLTSEEYRNHSKYMVQPRYMSERLIIAHFIGKEFKRRNPN
jgi:hypothetical protein